MNKFGRWYCGVSDWRGARPFFLWGAEYGDRTNSIRAYSFGPVFVLRIARKET